MSYQPESSPERPAAFMAAVPEPERRLLGCLGRGSDPAVLVIGEGAPADLLETLR